MLEDLKYYQQNAEKLVMQYDSLNPTEVHSAWLTHLPEKPGHALDIGAGSGRDARWLSKLGWQVTAIEPCDALRKAAQRNSQHDIVWLADTLPELESLNSKQYDLILISAVWMHLNPEAQERAYQRIMSLLSDNGVQVITWRNMATDTERQFSIVNETLFENADIITSNDNAGRHEVGWKCAILKSTAK